MDSIDKAAGDIKKLSESIYVPRHEYQHVDPRAFRHLDLRFYDSVRDGLVSLGCIWLGDVENMTLKGTPNDFRTFIRMMVSDDKLICIGLYHPKPKFWVRLLLWMLRIKVGKTIDCETELSNGGYLVTSNAAEAGKLNAPPGFDMKYFPVKTPHETIFEAHRQRLKDWLAANPGIHATAMRTPEDALEMQHRMQAAKAAYRKAVGHVSEDELRKMGADPQTAARIKRAMTRPED
jgi:hypothetical protein